MKEYYINGQLIAMTNTPNPHGDLREMLICAQINGSKIEIIER